MFKHVQRILNWELQLQTFEVEIPKWNVEGNKPTNTDILFVLFQTYESNGHVYIDNEYGKKIAGTAKGTPFRYIMYWLIHHDKLDIDRERYGRKLRPTDLESTCGDRECIREGHTKINREPIGHDYSIIHTDVPTYKARGMRSTKSSGHKDMLFTKEEANERRLRCISRKIWLNEAELRIALKELGPGHRGYSCKLGCSGFHTTSKEEVPKHVLKRRQRLMPY